MIFDIPPQQARQPLAIVSARGKSELRRAVRRVTPGQGDLKDSGTENTQLTLVTQAFGPASSKQW
jgi:hypothetical protein